MTVYLETADLTILHGDCRYVGESFYLAPVHSIVTSPPYYRQRDYAAGDDAIGLERTVEAYAENLAGVLDSVGRRVLRPDGTLWLNLGDTYDRHGELLGVPWLTAFALSRRGWSRRSAIVWAKEGGQPEAVENRPTSSYEYVFLFARRSRRAGGYFYDPDAIREPSSDDEPGALQLGRNARNVWRGPPSRYAGRHVAPMPLWLAARCLEAATSERGVCGDCGTPWRRNVEKRSLDRDELPPGDPRYRPSRYASKYDGARLRDDDGIRPGTSRMQRYVERRTRGFEPGCGCYEPIEAGFRGPHTVPATVLDPFAGAGTVGLAALRRGRRAVLIDLDRQACEEAARRVANREVEPLETDYAPARNGTPSLLDVEGRTDAD